MVLGCWRSPLSLVFTRRKSICLRTLLMPYTPEIIFLPNHSIVCLSLHLPSQPTSHLSIQPSICLFIPHPSVHLFVHQVIHICISPSIQTSTPPQSAPGHWLTVYSVGRQVCKITSGWSGQMQEGYKDFPWEHSRGQLSLYLVHQS